ncbi:MAG: serine/threonine protein kinase [Deltaproteobacteria bacterium]|nr:serine/threonine protein kinase [Deltaproteobacteria bacterium]MBW2024311.1 serine/threonine protein kinase [Deltaproteobacteria bacterium]MBW2125334.1 serine/threonine protein kinase [Deltaproteobacteria bacterium]
MASIASMNFDHLIGKQVGTSVLLKELARGGMGAIFIAYQKTLKRQIAVKILPKSLLTPVTAEFFRQEAEAAAILSHPNIIPVYEVGDTGEFLFFTMQLVNGRSLEYYIKKAKKNILPSRRALPVKSALNIMVQVLDALEFAHQQGIIHRDVKPANILMEKHTKRPILMDFGVAKVAKGPETTTSIILGTPGYMAPEQILEGDVDGRADIYAAGTMLFEMLSPEPLFPDVKSITQLLKKKVKLKDQLFTRRPSDVNPALGREMDEIILKAVAYDPGKRYATCREFQERVKEYLKKL